MTKFTIVDPVAVGRKIIEASQDDAKLRELVINPDDYFEGAAHSNNQTVVVHANSDTVTHVTIPAKTIVKEMLEAIAGGHSYSYPSQYDRASNVFIDPSTDPLVAYHFRVGDYTFAQCG